MIRYTKHKDVPAHYLNKTTFGCAGYKLASGQKTFAIFAGPTGPHPLYDKRLEIPKRQQKKADQA